MMPSETDIERLDAKSRKLLDVLSTNGRVTYTQLGKAIGLSKQSAEYRLRQLIDSGVLKGVSPIIDMPKLGYFYCRLLVNLRNITPEKEREILNYLENDTHVFLLYSMQGKYDLNVVIWAKSLTEFREFTDQLLEHYCMYIEDWTEFIGSKIVGFFPRYIAQSKNDGMLTLQEATKTTTIDELDTKILRELCNDGRVSLVQMSQTIGESAKVIAYRMKRLEEKKILLGFRPVIDHNKLGYTQYKLFFTIDNVTKDSKRKLMQHIYESHHVAFIIDGVGNHEEIEIEVMVQSDRELRAFINELRFTFPTLITNYTSVMFVDTLKIKFLPF